MLRLTGIHFCRTLFLMIETGHISRTASSCVSESLTTTLGKFQFTDLWKSSNFAVCGPPCVRPYQLCYGSIRSVEELFEALLVSGKSSPHHRHYSRQNEEGSGSRLRLDKCLLISAEMPGCFLISIPQHTAVVHLLIIQEEGCGYLMLCFRAFFSVHFPCSAFIPLCSFVSPSCCILYCAARHSHLRFAFFKKKRQNFCSVAPQPKVNATVCVRSLFMLQVILQCWAAGTGSHVLSFLHVCIINCLWYQP